MNTTNMIIVENRFKEMFNLLPTQTNGTVTKKPVFSWGDDKQLNQFLVIRDERPYPLIWLIYPLKERHLINRVELKNVSLILAINNDNEALSNEERMVLTFEKYLIPLYNNILKLFKKSNIIYVGNHYDIIKFPNYGELNVLRTKEEEKTLCVWDAIKVTFDCSINANCLNQITF